MSEVKLVSYTTNSDGASIKDLIIHCARVSNPESQASALNSDKLWDYLIKHKHWSPFEMASICMEINTTRDISRQILRHRSFSFQEFSQRYADPITLLTSELKDARMQDKKNRQNSIKTDDKYIKDTWRGYQSRIKDISFALYLQAINMGIAKEQARALLPEGLTGTRMYMHGTVRSWIHYIELRTGPETQEEHREIALQCKEVFDGLIV